MPRALSSLVSVVGAAAILAALVGCSGDQPQPDVSPSSSASPDGLGIDRSDELAALYAGNSAQPQDQGEARCFADALQERLSEQDLVDAGIVTADGEPVEALPVFDEPTATAWVDAQLSCVGFIEASTRALVTQTRGELDGTAYAACLRAAITDEEIRAALVQTLTGGFASPEVAALADAQAGCTT